MTIKNTLICTSNKICRPRSSSYSDKIGEDLAKRYTIVEESLTDGRWECCGCCTGSGGGSSRYHRAQAHHAHILKANIEYVLREE